MIEDDAICVMPIGDKKKGLGIGEIAHQIALRLQQRPGRSPYRFVVFDDKNLTLFDVNHTHRPPSRQA